MNNKQDLDLHQLLSKDEAIDLLFGKEEISQSAHNCFDEFGNYFFPTDMVANTPNTAIGTAVGLAYINNLNVSIV